MLEALEIWTIHERPPDYPHNYVARCTLIVRGNPKEVVTNTVLLGSLQMLRTYFAQHHFVCDPRRPKDVATIVESWMAPETLAMIRAGEKLMQ